jgi:hypothetical protein
MFALRHISVGLFGLVAILAFSCWAWGGNVFPSELIMYAACALVFLLGGGLAMWPVLGGTHRFRWTYCLHFALGYILYSILWSASWFLFQNTWGEILGSALGLAGLTCFLRRYTKQELTFVSVVAILFLFHNLGYYAGDFLHSALQGRGKLPLRPPCEPATVAVLCKLAWGVGYGLGLGWGLQQVIQPARQN